MLGLCHTLSHTLGHTLTYCIAIQRCGFIQGKQALQARPRLRSIPSHTQSPSKAPKRASKAPKTRGLGQHIGQHQKPATGPLFKPHQNGASNPLDSMVGSVVVARAHTRLAY